MRDASAAGVVAVVLAAGAASRFGGGKLLASLGGRPILAHVLDAIRAAGVGETVVVVGDDAEALEVVVDGAGARRVRNPDPGRGLSSSLAVGIAALGPEVEWALIVLGDQPLVAPDVIRALLAASTSPSAAASGSSERAIFVPVYPDDRGRNPVLLERAAFGLVAKTTGDRGLGPLIAARPDLVTEVPVTGTNPDVDTRADLLGLLTSAWAARVIANREQVDRFREVPDGTDFYAPVTGLFRADPRRTDDPSLDMLRRHVAPGDTWLDIGAGAGRYALPIAADLAASGGRVIAYDPSTAMLRALRELASEFDIANVSVVEGRWPPPDPAAFAADVAMIAHVSYDIEAIGPFVRAMEAAARRLCIAVLMERQPSSIADVCWPATHGEERIALPALPEFLELLRAMGREPSVQRLDREPRRFDDRAQLEGFLRRQVWVAPGSAADQRFVAALDGLVVVDADGRFGLRDQGSLGIGIVTWDPGRS